MDKITIFLSETGTISQVGRIIKTGAEWKKILTAEHISLSGKIPLKVHFGEQNNDTFIRPENFDGIIDYLGEKNIETCFIETSALYGGQRHNRELHLKTAQAHGFTRLDIIIADGQQGENFSEITINQKNFASCKIGRAFGDFDRIIVLAHFKGHMLAGFGGAIKQLAMGYASKGGKLAMHMGVKPRIKNRKCKKCHKCEERCNEKAITIGAKSFIDRAKCVGCGACISICPNKAISIISLMGIIRALSLGKFREKLAEYAYAAQKDKNNIYINFLMSITRGCDCEPKKMKPLLADIGICASTDPVAIDKASHDLVKARGKKFGGGKIFNYAEKIGLGSQNYTLVEEK